jgi:hypothetical protein
MDITQASPLCLYGFHAVISYRRGGGTTRRETGRATRGEARKVGFKGVDERVDSGEKGEMAPHDPMP